MEQGNRDELSLLVAKHGHWWALDEEPQPFHDGKGLLRLLEKVAPDGDSWKLVSEALGNEVSTESSHFIALRYPSRDEGFEWLVLTVAKEETKLLAGSEERRRERFERARVGAIHVNGAQPSSIQLRNTGVVNSNVREKTVALIGLGALGSRVAELLAQAGVGKFILCDLDRMNTGNVARHVGGLTDFGAKKTDVVMRRIFNINPHLQIVRFWDGSVLASLDGFADFISSADVVVSTVADENVESAMNQMAVIGDKTVVYGRAMRRGSMGRVFAVRPRIDACKTCIGLHARDARDGLKTGSDWIEVTEREEDVLIHECGRPVIPASAIDLSFIASLTARVGLDLLEGSQLVENHWVWSRETAEDVDARLSQPLTTVGVTLPRHEECPACREPEVTRVVLPDDVRRSMIEEVENSVSVETGGILIGYVDDKRRAVIMKATGPGPRAKKSASLFERDVEFVQSELDAATRELGSQGLYIGEWHSHLDPNPEPSAIDISSLCGIAEAPNYATRCPTMLIAGFDDKKLKVATIKAWTFPASGRMCSIEISSDS